MTEIGLKGPPGSAQGKATGGSVALGLREVTNIDREPAQIEKHQNNLFSKFIRKKKNNAKVCNHPMFLCNFLSAFFAP